MLITKICIIKIELFSNEYICIDLEPKNKVAFVISADWDVGREIALALIIEGVSFFISNKGVSHNIRFASNSIAIETSGFITQKRGKIVVSNGNVSTWDTSQFII